MQNMEKYFGFTVKVSEFLEPEDLVDIQKEISNYANVNEMDLSHYKIFMHQLVIESKKCQFGSTGGITSRITELLLKFTINPKQKKSGEIRFKNYLYKPSYSHDIKPWYMSTEIGYTIPSSYFLERSYFQNTLITFVKSEMRKSHQKIKVSVSANPTPEYFEKLKNKMAADSITNIDLALESEFQFNQQTKLYFENKQALNNKLRPNEGHQIHVYVKGDATINSGTQIHNEKYGMDPAQFIHVMKELKNLYQNINQSELSDLQKNDVKKLSEAIHEEKKGPIALKRLVGTGKWLGDKAEKIGVSLAAAILKDQILS